MDKQKNAQWIPDDDTMNVIMNTVYNQWFMRYKNRRITTDDDWTQVFRSADQLIEAYKKYPVVENLVITFLYEISARAHGGYTPAMQTKIRDLMEARYGK